MYGFFKFVLFIGVVASIAGFILPRVADQPAVANANLPPQLPQYLSFGGLGLVILGFAGRLATKPSGEEKEAEWK
jgi:hypothetical protein